MLHLTGDTSSAPHLNLANAGGANLDHFATRLLFCSLVFHCNSYPEFFSPPQIIVRLELSTVEAGENVCITQAQP
jgi:hypothetical protein